jgi:hypothetical protein
MGSSGGGSFKPGGTQPTPPGTVGYGQTSPFTPSYINFLGDTNVPSTGLTPEMLAQIDATNGAPQMPPPAAAGADRNMLAEIMARLDAMNKPKPFAPQQRLRGAQRNSGGR